MPDSELPRSQRILNYAKAVAAVIAASSGLSAFVIAVWFPSEPTATKSHHAVGGIVRKLSGDIRKEYDERAALERAMNEEFKKVRLEVQEVWKAMALQNRQRREVVRERVSEPPPKPAAAKKPAPLPPPQRELPSLEQIQQKAF